MRVAITMTNLSDLVKENIKSETSLRMCELETLFPHRKCWGESAWSNFPGFDLDLGSRTQSP